MYISFCGFLHIIWRILHSFVNQPAVRAGHQWSLVCYHRVLSLGGAGQPWFNSNGCISWNLRIRIFCKIQILILFKKVGIRSLKRVRFRILKTSLVKKIQIRESSLKKNLIKFFSRSWIGIHPAKSGFRSIFEFVHIHAN